MQNKIAKNEKVMIDIAKNEIYSQKLKLQKNAIKRRWIIWLK
jgi:hypothetical protein